MTELPELFKERMKKMLGEEYPAFLQSFAHPRFRGLRVNTRKISPEEFAQIAPFPVRPIPWTKNGFFYANDVFPAQHPFYAAGMYYLQEPSAMLPASRLPVQEDDRILDLCAAPGGKATELAARLNGTGILVANDISNARAKALLRNLELAGTEQYMVTNENPERLAEVFYAYFDKILVDAPCSGEGMFRKNQEAADAWSPAKVLQLSAQQFSIVSSAVSMLRPGGWLLYSTCTFSAEENEQVIHRLLCTFPELEICPIEGSDAFSSGRPEWADGDERVKDCVRIWPHRMEGEGHFLALLHKSVLQKEITGMQSEKPADRRTEKKTKKNKRKGSLPQQGENAISEEKRQHFYAFLGSVTEKKRVQEVLLSADEREANKEAASLECRGERAYLVPALPDGVGRLNFLRSGLFLGEWKKNRFEPSQPLAMAIRPSLLKPEAVLSLPVDDPRLFQYKSGASFSLTPEETEKCRNGWVLVCAEKWPLGWGKIAGTVLKNKYPASWRG